MNNTSKILSVSDLIVDFPVFGGILQKEIDQVHAVKKVSFELYKGETLGIVGESGSGKSTLGNAILNVLRLTAPDVKISGKINLNIDDNQIEISNLSRSESKPFRKHIQMIFQDPYSSLNPRMLVKDIIKEPLDINTDLSTIEKNEKVNWLLDKVGLSSEQATRYPHEFSGGQRQRIGIARSLATEPEIIIADEPVSALDVSIQAQIINLMMDLQEEFNLSISFSSLNAACFTARIAAVNKAFAESTNSRSVISSSSFTLFSSSFNMASRAALHIRGRPYESTHRREWQGHRVTACRHQPPRSNQTPPSHRGVLTSLRHRPR